MPGDAYAQRFVKWHMKPCDPSYAQFLRAAEFVDDASYRTLLEIAELYQRKKIRLLDHGLGWSETETIYEALVWTYYLSAKYELAGAKVMYRGQRDAAWPIVSSKSRLGTGLTPVFTQSLSDRIQTNTKWDFQEQLNAASQHYGFPTDLIDFSMDPDIAGYFAWLNGEENKTGSIYFTDATSEGWQVSLVFLPPMFRRIHNQAGVFFEAKAFDLPDEEIRFRHTNSDFRVYDAAGNFFDPLEDNGPIEKIAAEVNAGVDVKRIFSLKALEDFSIIAQLLQELVCSFRRGIVEKHRELVWRVAISNLDWWRANLEPYFEYCDASGDENDLQLAIWINEYVEQMKDSSGTPYSQEIAKRLGVSVIWE